MSIAVVGELLVDLVWHKGADRLAPHPGGSPANVALGLHRLGRPVTLISCWGQDVPGALIDAHLAATGLPIHRLPSTSRRTTLAVAYVNPDTGTADYDFLTAWDPVEIALPADTTLLHTGSLAAVVEPGATPIVKTCRALRRRPGHAVSIDLNVRPAALPDRDTYRAQAERITREADVVKASDEDLAWLYPDLSVKAAAYTLLALGPTLVVITQGAHGAFAVTRNHRITATAPTVEVVDTIGAGDAFQAALLDALLGPDGVHIPNDPAELEATLHQCVTAGAIACTHAGAHPPTRDGIDAI